MQEMVEAGVHGFALNLELFSATASQIHTRLKFRHARPHLESTIKAAVELLGRGTGRVRSLIVVGLEPIDETLAGVEWLARLGCDPVLSPFRPAAGTPLARVGPPSVAQLRNLLAAARSIASNEGVSLGPACVACQHNTLTFPWDVVTVANKGD
jgi:hypothetical protein